MSIGIVIGILLLFVVLFIIWITNDGEEVRVVLAGGIEKRNQIPYTIKISDLSKYKVLDHGGNDVNLREFEVFYVKGNSMKLYKIPDDSLVLISPLQDDAKSSITKYPVLLYRINDKKNNNHEYTEYKLRKFVRYIFSENDFNSWIENNKMNDDFDENYYIKKHDNFIEKYKKTSDFVYTISVTINDTGKKDFSFHSKDLIYGKIAHVIPHINQMGMIS